jgi:hypothetical protein
VTEEDVLQGLLVVSIALAALLVLVAMGSLGRKISDLELQNERGIHGVPRLQSWISIRSQIGNVALGVTFVIINVLLLAQAAEPWRMRTNRIFWTVLLAYVLAASILDWMAEREQVHLLIGAQEGAIASYRAMAASAVAKLETAASQAADHAGAVLPLSLAAVVPEHNSPVTLEQQETADVATLRARLVAASLALGIPVAEQPEGEDDAPPPDLSTPGEPQ